MSWKVNNLQNCSRDSISELVKNSGMHSAVYRTGHMNQCRGSNKWSVFKDAAGAEWFPQAGFEADSQRNEMIRQLGQSESTVLVNLWVLSSYKRGQFGGVRVGSPSHSQVCVNGCCFIQDSANKQWWRLAMLQKWGLNYCDEVQLVAPPWLWNTHADAHAHTHTAWPWDTSAFQIYLIARNWKYVHSIQFSIQYPLCNWPHDVAGFVFFATQSTLQGNS